jgi:hypothetical protein
MTLKIDKHMTWHHSHDAIDGVMMHPSNGEAWKHFNKMHLQYLVESRNVRFGLRVDGIQSIWVICYFLFLLADDTHDLELATGDVYEARFHVFIYGYTLS